ncbi:SGNH hydrolase-type esterase domain-containing protein [Xylariales sp. PMI_506]|nr:SGNH hydrolase-type esterase domain-containing protein [Xylariales sp. PMI_506]
MPLRIASIGSSFAAGPGLSPRVELQAGRSGANYANIVAKSLGADLTDLSVSGATLKNLLEEPQARPRKTYPPQIDGIPADADVVLVLGGGNDLGYIGGLFIDSFSAYWIFRAIISAYRWISGAAAEEEAPPPSAQDVAEYFGKVLDAVHQKSPKAQVVVVEYLTLLGPDLKPGVHVPFEKSLLEKHLATAERLQQATIMATQGREQWCARVPVSELSREHGLGSPEPWVNGFEFRSLHSGAAYHPNNTGMAAVADMVETKLRQLGLGLEAS